MVDTKRTYPALQTLLADNTTRDISPQDVRDFLASVHPDGGPNSIYELTNNVSIPVTTGSSVGVVLAGSDRFIHNYADGTSDGQNTFVGVNSGNFALGPAGGASLLGASNTALGHSTLKSLTTGNGNTAIGYNASQAATTAQYTTAIGRGALLINVDGYANTAVGYLALGLHTSGGWNQAFGVEALYSNLTGITNTALGFAAGRDNDGDNGIFLGAIAGKYETGSNKLFIDSLDRTNEAGGRTDSLIYGVMDSTVANQILAFNASVGIGLLDPDNPLEVLGTTGATGIKVSNAGDTAIDPTLYLEHNAGIRGVVSYDSSHGDLIIQNDFDNDAGEIKFNTKGGNTRALITGEGVMQLTNSLKISERPAALADSATYGQIWVKNTDPNELWFTDGDGTDTKIA